ncbi:MAG TPA: hypothetical protein VGC99_24600 [Candidatus Tectomicrobia bacterium]
MDERWCSPHGGAVRLKAHESPALACLRRLQRLAPQTPSAAGAGPPETGFRHAHHFIGNAVGFALELVIPRTYRELGLNGDGVEPGSATMAADFWEGATRPGHLGKSRGSARRNGHPRLRRVRAL